MQNLYIQDLALISIKENIWRDEELIFLIGYLNKIKDYKNYEQLNNLFNGLKKLNALFPNTHTANHKSEEDISNKLFELKKESTLFDKKNICKDGYIFKKYQSDPKRFDDLVFSLNLFLDQSCVIGSSSLNYSVTEGGIREKKHFERERDWKIIKAKKELVLFEKGVLECEACSFNFSKKYGQRGHHYLEVHHKKPISEYEDEEVTLLEDLCVLCSNCHKMIHRKKPWLSISALKNLINQVKVA